MYNRGQVEVGGNRLIGGTTWMYTTARSEGQLDYPLL